MVRELSRLSPSSRGDYTLANVARLVKVHRVTVRRRVLAGMLKTYRWGKAGQRVVLAEDLTAFLASRQAGASPTTKRSS